MFQEGHELATCALVWNMVVEGNDGTLVSEVPYSYGDTPAIDADQHAALKLTVTAPLPHAVLGGSDQLWPRPAVASATRQVRSSSEHVDEVGVYSLLEQEPGATAPGPAIVEGPFFTARVLTGWRFDVTALGDLMLTDIH
jgi:N-methylhydantoinase A/oxoprolinase/acetone carboxylase beta subunit